MATEGAQSRKGLPGPAGVREGVNQEMPFELCLEEGIGLWWAKKKGEEGRHSAHKGIEA